MVNLTYIVDLLECASEMYSIEGNSTQDTLQKTVTCKPVQSIIKFC